MSRIAKVTEVALFALAGVALLQMPAFAASTVTAELWDKGGDMTMAMDMGYGMAHAADAANAPMGIKLSTDTVPVGDVTFEVTNTSKDTIHEMIVMPLKDPSQVVPYDATMNEVMEDEAGDLGEVSELDPGASGSLTLPLKAGLYLLYCNVPGHFASGMWATLTVK